MIFDVKIKSHLIGKLPSMLNRVNVSMMLTLEEMKAFSLHKNEVKIILSPLLHIQSR